MNLFGWILVSDIDNFLASVINDFVVFNRYLLHCYNYVVFICLVFCVVHALRRAAKRLDPLEACLVIKVVMYFLSLA